MIRKIALGAATTLLVVGLPVAALGFSQSADSDSTPTVAAEPIQTSEQMEVETHEQLGTPPVDAVQAEVQTQARAQEMIHAETGIPEGEEPVQERTQAQVGTQTQDNDQAQANGQTQAHGQTQTQAGDGEPQGEAPADGEGHQHGHSDDTAKGNAGAQQSGDCTNDGECTNDGDCPNA